MVNGFVRDTEAQFQIRVDELMKRMRALLALVPEELTGAFALNWVRRQLTEDESAVLYAMDERWGSERCFETIKELFVKAGLYPANGETRRLR